MNFKYSENLKAKQLKICIFYHQSGWKQLLANYITRTIKDLRRNGNLSAFYIFLNSSYGDCITLILSVNSNVNLVREQISRINEYLKNFPSNSPATDLSNAPNNTFYIENETYNIDRLASGKFTLVCECLSSIILERYSTEEADDSSLFTLLLYLQLSVLKTSAQNYDPFIHNSRSWISSHPIVITLQIDAPIEKKAKQLFAANKATMLKMYYEVNVDTVKKNLSWLKKWEKACKAFFSGGTGIRNSSQALLHVVDRHLGVTDEVSNISLHMLKHMEDQILRKNIKEEQLFS